MGVGEAGAVLVVFVIIAMGVFRFFKNWTIFVLFLRSRNLPPTKKECVVVFCRGSTILFFLIVAQFLLGGHWYSSRL